MIRIRAIYNVALQSDRERMDQAQAIFREVFPAEAEYADKLPDMLASPFRYGYRAVVLLAEDAVGRVDGFALLLHFPQAKCSFLDFIAVRSEARGAGLGGALYEALREYCRHIGSRGLFMEVWPDDSSLLADPSRLAENQQRLRFYEQYGARPIVGTDYEKSTANPPEPPVVLVFDGLDLGRLLRRAQARTAVRLILKRKYGDVAPPGYIERVVQSFRDDPVRVREPRYAQQAAPAEPVPDKHLLKSFAVVASARHVIHHIRSRGYVERPARVETLLRAVRATGLFDEVEPRSFGLEPILAVHDAGMVDFLQRVAEQVGEQRPVYADVFPLRRDGKMPADPVLGAGFYCSDAITPLTSEVFRAASAAVDTALTAAEELVGGKRVAYALCRPPGHHAERAILGGYCYLNNAAIATQHLTRGGRKVAVVDIDAHHGNGTQDIFYTRPDVLTVSIHADPSGEYPYFTGYAEETGEGPGEGCNLNIPLPNGTEGQAWLTALEGALARVQQFEPAFLVVCLGLDVLRGDPTARLALRTRDMFRAGARLARLELPTLVVQEGGYNLRNLQAGAVAFFQGMARALIDARA